MCGTDAPVLALQHVVASDLQHCSTRLARSFAQQTRDVRGGFVVVRETYLRSDIVPPPVLASRGKVWLVPTASTLDRYLDVLDIVQLDDVVILGSVLARLKAMGFSKTLRRVGEALASAHKRWVLFLDEFCAAIPRRRAGGVGGGVALWTVQWLAQSLGALSVVVLSENDDFRAQVAALGVQAHGCASFVRLLCAPGTALHLVPPDVYAKAVAVCDSTAAPASARLEAFWTPFQLEQNASALVRGRLTVTHRHGGSDESRVAHLVLCTKEARGRAMHGDVVYADPVRKRVVGVVERNARPLVATLTVAEAERVAATSAAAAQWVVVAPMDARLPLMRVKTRLAGALVGARFVCKVDEWPDDSAHPSAHYLGALGPAMDLETESSALLIETGLDGHAKPFAALALACLPPADFVPDLDTSHREDARALDVVSIDPVGCQDIDDALSLRALPGGDMELGVHIADVAFFVAEGSALDQEARARATSVYLEDRRLDMLPARLCEDLASLRPGVPRFALSVFWRVSRDGAMVDAAPMRVGRTLIQSRYALSYEQAQRMADAKDPGVSERAGKGWTGRAVRPEDVAWLREAVRGLMRVAQRRKASRVRGVALEAGGEFAFDLDAARNPVAVHGHDALEVHDTIAELMIVANEAVAARLLDRLPSCALIRHHPPASEDRFAAVKEFCDAKGVRFVCATNKDVADSLRRARAALDKDSMAFLDNSVTRAMSEAQYAAGGAAGTHFHYGLGLDTYTHFTSPIRRYADLVVARQLLHTLAPGASGASGASATEPVLEAVPEPTLAELDLGDDFSWADVLGGETATPASPAKPAAAAATTPPSLTASVPPLPDYLNPLVVSDMCAHMNVQHRAAKDASARSQELFFSLFFKDHPMANAAAVVADVEPLTCFLPDFALTLPLRVHACEVDGDMATVRTSAAGAARVLRKLDAVRVHVTCPFDPGLPPPRPPRPQLALLDASAAADSVSAVRAPPMALRSSAQLAVPTTTSSLDGAVLAPRTVRAKARPSKETCVRKGPGRVVYGDYAPDASAVAAASIKPWDEDEEDATDAAAAGGLSASRASAADLRRAEKEATARVQKLLDKKYDARVKQRMKKEKG